MADHHHHHHHTNSEVRILKNLRISPPPGSVPTTSLPLTFFDIPWLLCRPMQLLFFYEFPHSTLHFLHHTLPSLTHSLSITLQHFYPLAATLRLPPPPHTPSILFTEDSFVPFTVAESTVDFHQLIASNNHPRSVTCLHPLVPKLPPPCAASSPDGVLQLPILAIQVVMFPNSGICIGAEFHHAAADGMSFTHFMKSWAAVFRSGGGLCSSPPCLDRSLIRDTNDFKSIFIREWWSSGSYIGSNQDQEHLLNKVRATHLLTKSQLQNLKNWVSRTCDPTQFHISTFVIVCAFVWVCMIKAKLEQENDGKICHFSFVADCRNRLEYTIPSTYFGNCLAILYTSAKESELVGEDGMVVAVKAIGGKIKEMNENGVLGGAHEWMSKWKEVSENGSLITVAGSPKLRIFDIDFGWGRLKKKEVVQIDASGAMYVSESGDDEEGGIQIGLALLKDQMKVFNGVFEQNLQKCLS